MKKRRVVLVPVLVSLLLTAGGVARYAQAADCEGAWAFGRIPFSGPQWGWTILWNYCAPDPCGSYSTVFFAGQSTDVASLRLSHFHDPAEPDLTLGNSLRVEINPRDGYLLEDVRMRVSTSPLPKHPVPGKFPYRLEPNELGEFDALIPLTMAPLQQLYVTAHAEACSVLP